MVGNGVRVALLAALLTLLGSGSVAAAPLIGPDEARLVLSSLSGPSGSTVTVTGSSFPATTTGTLAGGGMVTTFRTTRNGTFTAERTIDAASAGTVTFRASAGRRFAKKAFVVTAPRPRVVRSAPLRFGMTTPGGPVAAAELDAAAAALGEDPSVLLWFEDFRQGPPLAALDAAAARGATPIITWEPWAWGGGVHQPAFASDRITAGDHDAYIASWGRALAAWGGPVLLRYGHEMNGPWYPWSDAVNGNGRGDFVAAWRHVHDVVASTGASNVRWVWSPTVPGPGVPAFATMYPGSAYVDVVALDGYNWGTTAAWSSWTRPATLFGAPLDRIRAVAPGKPIIIAETASAEAGGSKAAWVRELIAYLSAQKDVETVVWFNEDKEVDWRFDSSPASTAALRDALAARLPRPEPPGPVRP